MPVNDKALLLKEIEEVFPFVEKPNGLSLSYHKAECAECEGVRRDLEAYSEPELPNEALRYLHNEMGCLSAKAWRWVFPSYLRYCVDVDDTYDGVETEYLIYNFSPELRHQTETYKQLSEFNQAQIDCLIHFLEWCSVHPHWSEYCKEDIENAIGFIKAYRHNKSLHSDSPKARR